MEAMSHLRTDTLLKTPELEAALIQTRYAEPYAEPDFTPLDAVSFPLRSCYGYQAGGRELMADDNSLLAERRQTEFVVRKFNPFRQDSTLCIFLPDGGAFGTRVLLGRHRQAALLRRSPEVETLLRRFLRVCAANAEHFFQNQCLHELLDAVFSGRPETLPENGPYNFFQRKQLEQAKDYLHANHGEALRLSDMAAAAHVSPFHFSRLFRRATGYSPYDYLLRVRIEHAKGLLKNGLPVSQTAYTAGFNSLENFSLAFKKMTGSAPAHFQKRKIY